MPFQDLYNYTFHDNLQKILTNWEKLIDDKEESNIFRYKNAFGSYARQYKAQQEATGLIFDIGQVFNDAMGTGIVGGIYAELMSVAAGPLLEANQEEISKKIDAHFRYQIAEKLSTFQQQHPGSTLSHLELDELLRHAIQEFGWPQQVQPYLIAKMTHNLSDLVKNQNQQLQIQSEKVQAVVAEQKEQAKLIKMGDLLTPELIKRLDSERIQLSQLFQEEILKLRTDLSDAKKESLKNDQRIQSSLKRITEWIEKGEKEREALAKLAGEEKQWGEFVNGVKATSKFITQLGLFTDSADLVKVGALCSAGIEITASTAALLAASGAMAMLGPIAAIGIAVLSIASLFKKKKTKSIEQILIKQIAIISQQVEQLRQDMFKGFEHLAEQMQSIEENNRARFRIILDRLHALQENICQGFTIMLKKIGGLQEYLNEQFSYLEVLSVLRTAEIREYAKHIYLMPYHRTIELLLSHSEADPLYTRMTEEEFRKLIYFDNSLPFSLTMLCRSNILTGYYIIEERTTDGEEIALFPYVVHSILQRPIHHIGYLLCIADKFLKTQLYTSVVNPVLWLAGIEAYLKLRTTVTQYNTDDSAIQNEATEIADAGQQTLIAVETLITSHWNNLCAVIIEQYVNSVTNICLTIANEIARAQNNIRTQVRNQVTAFELTDLEGSLGKWKYEWAYAESYMKDEKEHEQEHLERYKNAIDSIWLGDTAEEMSRGLYVKPLFYWKRTDKIIEDAKLESDKSEIERYMPFWWPSNRLLSSLSDPYFKQIKSIHSIYFLLEILRLGDVTIKLKPNIALLDNIDNSEVTATFRDESHLQLAYFARKPSKTEKFNSDHSKAIQILEEYFQNIFRNAAQNALTTMKAELQKLDMWLNLLKAFYMAFIGIDISNQLTTSLTVSSSSFIQKLETIANSKNARAEVSKLLESYGYSELTSYELDFKFDDQITLAHQELHAITEALNKNIKPAAIYGKLKMMVELTQNLPSYLRSLPSNEIANPVLKNNSDEKCPSPPISHGVAFFGRHPVYVESAANAEVEDRLLTDSELTRIVEALLSS